MINNQALFILSCLIIGLQGPVVVMFREQFLELKP